MIRGVEVLCGVFVFRGIAAADMAALEAQAQMHPVVSDFQAVFTAVDFGFDVANGIEVRAVLHESLLDDTGGTKGASWQPRLVE